MARYFFHLLERGVVTRDEEGRELADPATIAAAALREARDVIGHDAFAGVIRLGQRIQVEDEAHVRVHTLAFADAVRIAR